MGCFAFLMLLLHDCSQLYHLFSVSSWDKFQYLLSHIAALDFPPAGFSLPSFSPRHKLAYAAVFYFRFLKIKWDRPYAVIGLGLRY